MGLSITAAELWARLGQDESGTVEFKRALAKAGRMQDPLVAFANSRGGTVAVGVAEGSPPDVVGVDWGQAQEERIQEIARQTHPPIPIDTELAVVDGRPVALLRVEPVRRGWVQSSDGRVIVRAGPTNRTLIGEELARFIRERSVEPVEDEPVAAASLDDLDQRAVRQFLRRRLGIDKVSVHAGLRDLGYLTPAGEVRLATMLLFGKRPQQDNRRLGIDITRYGGSFDGRTIFRKRQQLVGTLPELVNRADRALYEESSHEAVIRGLVREEVPEYPPVALREALVNAVGHRDYSLSGAAVEVRIYDDAVEIESPGNLPGHVTVENLLEAQYSRNRRIMDAFHVLGLVEEAGTGINRMVAEMEDAVLEPPRFEERDRAFVVRFVGRSVFAAEDRLWISRFSSLGLSAAEKVALVYARRHGAVRNEDLRGIRNLDSATSRAVLADLVNRGLLTALGRGRGTRYVLAPLSAKVEVEAGLDEQIRAVVAHARRTGLLANRDVRGLLQIDAEEARRILTVAVARGLLEGKGERRGRTYTPTNRSEDLE